MSPGPASAAVTARTFVQEALAGVDDSVVHKVLHGNAERLYGISAAGSGSRHGGARA